jgi:hypothetical protein
MNYEINGKGLIIYAEQLNALYFKKSQQEIILKVCKILPEPGL